MAILLFSLMPVVIIWFYQYLMPKSQIIHGLLVVLWLVEIYLLPQSFVIRVFRTPVQILVVINGEPPLPYLVQLV